MCVIPLPELILLHFKLGGFSKFSDKSIFIGYKILVHLYANFESVYVCLHCEYNIGTMIAYISEDLILLIE